MNTAWFYDVNDNLHTARILDELPAVGSEFPGTGAVVYAIETPYVYIDSRDESIANGTVYLVHCKYPDDRFSAYVLIPRDMTMTPEEFVRNVMDGDRMGIDYMSEEDAAGTLDVFRRDDYKHQIPDTLTAAEFARIWNEIKGACAPLWYALMTGPNDNDWGYGTHDKDKAIAELRDMRVEWPDAYIAVIRKGNDPVCVDEIHDI